MKILIVDDDRTGARLLLSYLEDKAECFVAHTGEEALEEVKIGMESSSPYDLICLDIMMPVIDGHETLRTIREFEQSTFNVSGARTKIIMTTAMDDMKSIMKSFKELCDGYLVKPITKRDLLVKIEEIGLTLP